MWLPSLCYGLHFTMEEVFDRIIWYCNTVIVSYKKCSSRFSEIAAFFDAQSRKEVRMHATGHAPDRVVIVTGAARGLGRAMTLGLLAAGRRVVAFDLPNSAVALAELAKEAKASGASERLLKVDGDVRLANDCDRTVQAAMDRFGALHAVVNCAALGQDFNMHGDSLPGTGKFYEVRSSVGKQPSTSTSTVHSV